MKHLNLLFLGADRSVFDQIQSALDGVAIVEAKRKAPEGVTHLDHDAIIADCRKIVLDIENPTIPTLAIIEFCALQREEVYSQGYTDYLTWPLLGCEIRQRFKALNVEREFPIIEPLVENACKVLVKNLSAPCDLPSLCRIIGTNPSTLTEKFHKELSTTPMNWIRYKRLEKASEYLTRTDLPVTEIATRIGYKDSNNFSTSFRRQYGKSPRGYRKTNK